jgi:hypothetical protein
MTGHSLYLLLAFICVMLVVGAGPLGGFVLRVRTSEKDRRRAALEKAKLAKYREIRDAQLDWRIGKLSDADFEAHSNRLHAEAIAILKQLEQLERPDYR